MVDAQRAAHLDGPDLAVLDHPVDGALGDSQNPGREGNADEHLVECRASRVFGHRWFLSHWCHLYVCQRALHQTVPDTIKEINQTIKLGKLKSGPLRTSFFAPRSNLNRANVWSDVKKEVREATILRHIFLDGHAAIS